MINAIDLLKYEIHGYQIKLNVLERQYGNMKISDEDVNHELIQHRKIVEDLKIALNCLQDKIGKQNFRDNL